MLSFVLEWFKTENSVEEKHMEYAALAAVSYMFPLAQNKRMMFPKVHTSNTKHYI